MRSLIALVRFLRSHLGAVALGVTLALVTVLANVALMGISGWFLASMAVAGATGAAFNYFMPGVLVRVAALVRTVGRYLERLVNHGTTLRVLSEIRVWVYRVVEPLAPARIAYHRAGDLLSRIRSDVDTLDNFYVRAFVPTFVAILGSIATVAIVSIYSLTHAVALACALVAAGVLVPIVAARAGGVIGSRVVDEAAALRGAIVAHARGVPELVALGAEGRFRSALAAQCEQYDRRRRSASWLAGATDAAMVAVSHGAVLVALILSAGSTRFAGPVSALLVSLFYAAFEAVVPMQQAAVRLGESVRAAERLFELARLEPAVTEPCEPVALPSSTRIAFRNVSLAYDERRLALADVSFDIAAGEHVAIVGPTGSGKSSIVNILLRFYEYGGNVTIGGTELRSAYADDARRRFALAAQRPELFHSTIRDNLLIGRGDATDADLHAALDLAGAGFVGELEDGLDTMIGEAGTKLSSGQARRIALARAVLKDASVLILDEPTEGLDAQTAGPMLRRLLAAYSGRTVVLITHRGEEERLVDRVIRIVDGRLVP